MKKFLPICMSLLLIGSVVVLSPAARLATADETARAAAIKLYQSLSDEQKKSAVKDLKDKDRYTEAFPAVNRPGIPYAKLSAEQKGIIDEVVKAMTSEYGYQRCTEIPKETGENQRFLTFFGEPSAKTPFAWRIGMHHLTLIYAEFGGDKSNEFGPILLGGNPAKTLWDAEEKLALELYAALSAEETKNLAAATKGASSGSGGAIGQAGVKIKDLNDKARKLAGELLQKRLDVFSTDRRKVIDDIIQRDGGVDNLRLAVWGAITKPHKDGGNYHWRIGGDSVVCDWQTVGKNHIHMTLRGRVKGG
jgi:hypothetical protein